MCLIETYIKDLTDKNLTHFQFRMV